MKDKILGAYHEINDLNSWKEISARSNRLEKHFCNMVIESGSFNEFTARFALGSLPLGNLIYNVVLIII